MDRTAGGIRAADGSFALTGLRMQQPSIDSGFDAYAGLPAYDGDPGFARRAGGVAGLDDWGLGAGWDYSTAAGVADPAAGAGGMAGQAPRLVQLNGDDSLAVVNGACGVHFFDFYDGGYHDRYNSGATLTAAGGQFAVTDTAGNTWNFYDFSSGTPAGAEGQLTGTTTAAGVATAVDCNPTTHLPEEVQRVVGDITQSLVSTYVAFGANAGLLSTLTLRQKVGTGSWQTLRTIEYTYYTNADVNGRATQLKSATLKDAAGAVVDADYYRYYVPSSGTGLLKYAFGPAAYARLTAALGTAVDALSDGQVDYYADHYLAYDSAGRVVTHTVAGDGCSACTGGQGTYTYAYASNVVGGAAIQIGTNVWTTKVTETLPDGSTNAYYTNALGQTMLQVFADAAISGEWCRYARYDAVGRTVLTAGPAGVTGYDEAYADLVNDQGGNCYYLADAGGVFATAAYAEATTATSSAAGDAAGRLTGTAIRRGELGAAVPQLAETYVARTAGGQTQYVPAAVTEYRNDDGRVHVAGFDGRRRDGDRHAAGGDNGPERAERLGRGHYRLRRRRPADVAAGRGRGPDVRRIRPADGGSDEGHHRRGHDTDRRLRRIAVRVGDAVGRRTALVSTHEVDPFGRTTKATSAAGRVDFAAYDDANHEAWYYSGWDAATETPTGPTTVVRDDRAGGYAEALTMSAAPAVSSGRPTGAEAVSGVQSLSRAYRNAAGQVTHADGYFDRTGVMYSTASNLGTLGTNHVRTTTGRGKQAGQVNRQVSAAGTITRIEHDGLGRATSVWVGTDDTPATGFRATTSLTGTDMVQVAAFEYGGGVGNGNLTKVTDFPGGGAADRVTEYFYDWRDRLVATKQGVQTSESTAVNRPVDFYASDNLETVPKVAEGRSLGE